MKAKGCISEILDWKRAREFFYYRIRRRLKEDETKSTINKIHNDELTDDSIIHKVYTLIYLLFSD